MRWLAYKGVMSQCLSCSGVGMRGATKTGAIPYREYHWASSIRPTVRYGKYLHFRLWSIIANYSDV